jgi:nucleoside-diphosphate-sugar epimerase
MAAAAKKILVTGSNGLIGSVEHFAGQGHIVHGIDNNMRADFFAAPRTAEVYNLAGAVRATHRSSSVRHDRRSHGQAGVLALRRDES